MSTPLRVAETTLRLVSASCSAMVFTAVTVLSSRVCWSAISPSTLATCAVIAPTSVWALAITWLRAASLLGLFLTSDQLVRNSDIAAATPVSLGSPMPVSTRDSALARRSR